MTGDTSQFHHTKAQRAPFKSSATRESGARYTFVARVPQLRLRKPYRAIAKQKRPFPNHHRTELAWRPASGALLGRWVRPNTFQITTTASRNEISGCGPD
jgi:hypothetical protein